MSSGSVGISVKRKGKGKRCLDGARVAGKADAGSRAQRLIAAWQADAVGDVADRLASLALAMARSQGPHDGIGDGMADAAPQHLRQDW